MATLGIEEDWWLYVVLFAALFILLAVNSYVVVIWQHPDDKNEAYFPKAVVVSSGARRVRRWSLVTHIPLPNVGPWLSRGARAVPPSQSGSFLHGSTGTILFFFQRVNQHRHTHRGAAGPFPTLSYPCSTLYS